MFNLNPLFKSVESLPKVSKELNLIVTKDGVGITHARTKDIKVCSLSDTLDAYVNGDKYEPCYDFDNLFDPIVELARQHDTQFHIYIEPETRMGLNKFCISGQKAYVFNFCDYLVTEEGWNALIENLRKQVNDTIPTPTKVSLGD